jgi:hypothetical protein
MFEGSIRVIGPYINKAVKCVFIISIKIGGCYEKAFINFGCFGCGRIG